MNVVQSSLTYAGSKLFFKGVEVKGFRTLKVTPTDIRVTVWKSQAETSQLKAMKEAGIKVWSMK